MQTKERPTLSPGELSEELEQGRCVLVDVREGVEWQQGHVDGGRHVPLGELGVRCEAWPHEERVVVMCASGKRSEKGAALLRERGFLEVVELEGGMEGWSGSGLSVSTPESSVWALDRQVRFTAGALVILGLAGSSLWAPAIYLSWFVGIGLVFAALVDWCGMGMLLAKAPWNQVKTPALLAGGVEAAEPTACSLGADGRGG